MNRLFTYTSTTWFNPVLLPDYKFLQRKNYLVGDNTNKMQGSALDEAGLLDEGTALYAATFAGAIEQALSDGNSFEDAFKIGSRAGEKALKDSCSKLSSDEVDAKLGMAIRKFYSGKTGKNHSNQIDQNYVNGINMAKQASKAPQGAARFNFDNINMDQIKSQTPVMMSKFVVEGRRGSDGGDGIDWTGVINAGLNVLGGVGEIIVGGAGEYFSAGTATSASVPLIVDGGVRVSSNSARLTAYFTGHNNAGNAIPSNAGAWIGKGVDMVAGKSFYDYGYGQALGGVTNDFVSFIVTGGTAGSTSNMVSNPTLMNGVWYTSSFGGYTNSLFYDAYPLKNK